MKKLLVVTLCLFSSLSLYSQDKTTPFWALMSFDNSGKVIAYQGFEKTTYDQIVSLNKAFEDSYSHYGAWTTEAYKYTSASEFVGKILADYCFVGDQAQAYSDLFKNSGNISIANRTPDSNGEYSENIDRESDHPNVVITPLIRTYNVSLDTNSNLKIVLTSEKECSEFSYVRTDDEGDHPTARVWDIYTCKKWAETNPNTVIAIKSCENWKEPLKEFLIKLYNLPKEIF